MTDPNLSQLFNKTGTLYRTTIGARNSLGEPDKTLSETATIKLNLQFLKEKYTIEKDGVTYTVSKKAFMYLTDVKAGDYLVVDGITHLVVGVENETSWDHHLRVFLMEQ